MKVSVRKLIPVCVYADSTGLYTADECDFDNLCEIYFPVGVVKAWYELKVQPAYGAGSPEASGFWTWFKDYSYAEDTDGLYEFALNSYGFRGKRLDGLERKDVELAETIAETLDREDLPWWDKWNTHDIIEMLNDVDSCKKIIDSLLVMLINRGC